MTEPPPYEDIKETPENVARLTEFIRSQPKVQFTAPVFPSYIAEPMDALISNALATEMCFGNLPVKGDDSYVFPTLKGHAHFFKNIDYYLNEFTNVLQEIAAQFRPAGYAIAHAGTPLVKVALWQLLPDPRGAIDHLIDLLLEKPMHRRSEFHLLSIRIEENMARMLPLKDRPPFNINVHHLISASKSKLTVPQLIDGFFNGTPFRELFTTPVAIAWEHKDRARHTHILGSPGAGKTTLLKNLVTHDIWFNRDKPSLVIVDPQSSLIPMFKEMQYANRRVLLISPRDIDHPPAINPFAPNARRLASYSREDQQRMTANALETVTYLLGVLGLDMTGRQQGFFNYLVRFLLSFPVTMGRNATIKDLVAMMDRPEKYEKGIEKLPETQRDFLLRELFPQKKDSFADTKLQIRNRLDVILGDPMLEGIFTAPESRVDFFEELNQGTVILVDTAEDFLGEAGSKLFGAMVIALVQQALKERVSAGIPEGQRYPTYLYVDEAHNYFGVGTEKLMTDLRKLGCGLVLAHHNLGQCDENLRAALLANTSIKFARTIKDARDMAPIMRTEAETLSDMPQYTFAFHIEDRTPHAVPFKVPPPRSYQRKSNSEMAEFLELNRQTVSVGNRIEMPQPEPETPAEGTADDEWGTQG